jgi:2-amino-4-hydroxy-6-hydroxymethyldihydropteridine diphosphokinase
MPLVICALSAYIFKSKNAKALPQKPGTAFSLVMPTNDYIIMQNTCYLLLGSNMGNSKQMLARASAYLAKKAGQVLRQSKLYSTAAWGNTEQPDFLNQVLVIQTQLDAPTLLKTILAIEKQMGRVRTVKNAPRTIDIDILFFNKQVIQQPDLVVPHPHIPNRRFVLVPLNEIAPAFVHPVLQKNIHQLLLQCTDPLAVKKN